MIILVLNSGSSSLKYQLIDIDKRKVLAKGNYERIGEDEAFLTHKVGNDKKVINKGVKNHDEALKIILETLLSKEFNTIKSLDEIDGIGHRIVHGGEIFKTSCLVSDKVIDDIKKCAVFAPLHNPAAVSGIIACKNLMKDTPMVVVFDTAFHQTMPKESYMYPIPVKYYEKYGVRKYGAHGTSHKYVAQRFAALENKDLNDLKLVTCHLGQGASITAIKGGKCVDTSMGLTPLAGIPMVTRSGDLDPSVVTYIMENENLSPKEMENILNKESGLAGMTGLAKDFRQIENKYMEDDSAHLAIDVFCTKVAEYIARYAARLDGIDGIVFTGGIGENQINVRKLICEHLKFMGVDLDTKLNEVKSEECKISNENSKITLYVIPTDEEMVIAKETERLIRN